MPVEVPGLEDEATAITDALRHPLAGPPLGELLRRGPAGGRRVPRPDPSHAEPHRAATAPRGTGAGRSGRRSHHAPVRHRDAPSGQRGGDGGARRRGRRRPLHPGRPRRDQRRARAGRRGGRDARAAAARVRGGGRPYPDRVRRAALLRRFQWRPQGCVPGAGRHRDHPGGPPSPPDRRRPRHLRHPRRQSGARLRTRRDGLGAARPVARRRHQPGAAGDRRLRRSAARSARRGVCITCSRRRSARSAPPSTSWSRPTAGTHSTATSTRPSRAWPRPSASCATQGSSSWPPPARTVCRPAARSPASWVVPRPQPQLAGASGGSELDRWQAQVLGRVLSRAEVHFHGAGLDQAEIEDAFLVPAPDLDGAVAAALGRLGPVARVAVIPEGPLTVATVRPPG